MSGNFLAPCAHPIAILDVICGSGAWTADMGKLFPESFITGMDAIRPSCPQPSSFQFVEGRTPSVLPFNDAQFDYVHQRCLGTVVPIVHWQGIANELVRVTRFGGWIELMEYGAFANAGPATQQFFGWWQSVKMKQGIDLLAMEHLGELLQNAGLTHVNQKTISIPLYGGGRATDAMRTNLLALIQMAKTSILALGVSHSTWVSVTSSLPEEWLKYKTAYQFYVAYGQREQVGARKLFRMAVATKV